MSNFSPSLHFSKHWLELPVAAKQAFYQELSDIAQMLQSDGHAQDFHFEHEDFDSVIADLLSSQNHQAPAKPTEHTNLNADNTSTVHVTEQHPTTPVFNPQEQAKLESDIYDKLAVQIDDVLSEHMSQLSEDLKEWLKSAIKDELAKHQP